MNATAKKRALIACFSLAGCFTAFSFRLVQIQVTQHDEYVAIALEKHGARQTMHARRGLILDTHGESLAQNEPVRTVVADASLISDREAVAALLVPALGMPHAQIMEKLGRETFSQTQKKNVPAQYIVLKSRVPGECGHRPRRPVGETEDARHFLRAGGDARLSQ